MKDQALTRRLRLAQQMLILALLLPLVSAAEMRPVIVAPKLSCTKAQPCIVQPVKNGANFHVEFRTKSYNGMDLVEQVSITNLKTKETRYYQTPDTSGLPGKQPLRFYEVDLGRGSRDLALYASDSPNAGPMYHYFLYDAKKQEFVMSKDVFPELQPKGHGVLTDGQMNFTISPKLQIRPQSTSNMNGANDGHADGASTSH